MANHLQVPLTKPDRVKEEQEVEEEARLLARRLANAAALPMVLKAALELGVIDTITTVGGGDLWLSPSEIALRLPTKPCNLEAPVLLDRMLRFLVSHSVLKCRTVIEENGQTGKVERVYAAEPVCKYLLNKSDDVSGSFASLFMLDLSDVFIKTWYLFAYNTKTIL